MGKIDQLFSTLSKISKYPEQIAAKIEKLGKFKLEKFRARNSQIIAAITPAVKRALADSYRGSGVGIDSGTLYGATVRNVLIKGDETGITVMMQPGVVYKPGRKSKNRTANVYGSAGAKKYGGHRLHGGRRLTGVVRTIAINKQVAGVSELKPFPDFFTINLESGEIAETYAREIKRILNELGIETN